jgi:hypothetical protein
MTNRDKEYFKRMSTVLSFDISGEDRNAAEERCEKLVWAKVNEIVAELKKKQAKFEDPDFGPTKNDEFGALALYGSVTPPSEGYGSQPPPETLRWDRPLYDDGRLDEEGEGGDDASEGTGAEQEGEDEFDMDFALNFDESPDPNDVWCQHGALFIDGSSSQDVIQGQLGDCWFLGALALMGTKENLLRERFFPSKQDGDQFKEWGLYVVSFFKDTRMCYVIMDDRIPVFAKTGRVVFASCVDPNELWGPLIEKAYAKLHGCYKHLKGGYVHYGLGDLTGFSPRAMGLRPGYDFFSDKFGKEEVWHILNKYAQWGSLMGCSVQPNPQAKGHSVEADAGQGLIMGHAYSLLALGTIKWKGKDFRLLKLRNPWGRHEWNGAWSDSSDEREQANDEIERVFDAYFRRQDTFSHENQEVNDKDGAFFMSFDDFFDRFTTIFAAVSFGDEWCGQRVQGEWKGDIGSRLESTWFNNPKIKMRIPALTATQEKLKDKNGKVRAEAFVGLYIEDTRLRLGNKYNTDRLYATPLAFDIVTEEELDKISKGKLAASNILHIPHGVKYDYASGGDSDEILRELNVNQPAYQYGSTQVEVYLEPEIDYFIVPNLRSSEVKGKYYLNCFCEAPFELERGVGITAENKPIEVLPGPASVVAAAATATASPSSEEKKKNPSSANATSNGGATVSAGSTEKITTGQFFVKTEEIRSLLANEAKELGKSVTDLANAFADFPSDGTISKEVFKSRLSGLGFKSVDDVSDKDLNILDKQGSGVISKSEFLDFFRIGLEIIDPHGASADTGSKLPVEPAEPINDLIFRADVDQAGVLSVKISEGSDIRKAVTWFSLDKTDGAGPARRNHLKYDKADAEHHQKGRLTASWLQSYHLEMSTTLAYTRLLQGTTDPEIQALGTNEASYAAARSGLSRQANNSTASLLSPTKDGPAGKFSNTTKEGLDIDVGGLEEKDLHTDLGTTGLSAPNSPERGAVNKRLRRDRDKDIADNKSVVTMVTSRTEAFERAGKQAAERLHKDEALQQAETERTHRLAELKKARQSSSIEQMKSSLDQSGVLRSKKSRAATNERRRGCLLEDHETCAFLGLQRLLERESQIRTSPRQGENVNPQNPHAAANNAALPGETGIKGKSDIAQKATNGDQKAGVQAAATTLQPTTVVEDHTPDIWDLLIDRVETLYEARKKNKLSRSIDQRAINQDLERPEQGFSKVLNAVKFSAFQLFCGLFLSIFSFFPSFSLFLFLPKYTIR